MYYRTIKAEQGMLLAKFKDAYSDYCKQVPAMIPCLVPYSKGEKWPFNLQRLINSKEHKPVFWIFILLVVFHLKTRVLIEHKGLYRQILEPGDHRPISHHPRCRLRIQQKEQKVKRGHFKVSPF